VTTGLSCPATTTTAKPVDARLSQVLRPMLHRPLQHRLTLQNGRGGLRSDVTL
jgi:hypothetical protein